VPLDVGLDYWPVELASRKSNLIWRSCSSTYGQKAMRSSRTNGRLSHIIDSSVRKEYHPGNICNLRTVDADKTQDTGRTNLN
jgi:hypothetical protein